LLRPIISLLKYTTLAAAALLRFVHRHVCVHLQRFSAGPVFGIETDADAGADVNRLVAELDRLRRGVDDPLRDVNCVRFGVGMRQQNRELVAAGSRQRIGRSYAPADPVANLGQQPIARAQSALVSSLADVKGRMFRSGCPFRDGHNAVRR
jgi:hypothetical protein